MSLTPLALSPPSTARPTPSQRTTSGFPSPADDYLEAPLDLHRRLVPHPAATFFMRVEGQAQAAAGFRDQDLLVVDRSLTPRRGDWVIAAIDGELCLQRLDGDDRRRWLCPATPGQARLPLGDDDCRLWGVVSHVIHGLRRGC